MEIIEIKEDPPIKYIMLIVLDIIMALVLGVATNYLVNYFTRVFRLSFYAGLVLQIIIVAFVIYLVKKFGDRVHQEPRDSYSYDLIFIALYISSQHNFMEVLRRFSNNHYDF